LRGCDLGRIARKVAIELCYRHSSLYLEYGGIKRAQAPLVPEIAPLDREQVEELAKLTGISEIHDRMIVAVAKLRGAKLVLEDQESREGNLVLVIGD
jgi:hypothetical protein